MEHYIVLKFGSRRVLLYSPEGNGATYTRHLKGHSSFAFDGCNVVGSVIICDGQAEPSLADLISQINTAYAPGYITPEGLPAAHYVGTTKNGERFTATVGE